MPQRRPNSSSQLGCSAPPGRDGAGVGVALMVGRLGLLFWGRPVWGRLVWGLWPPAVVLMVNQGVKGGYGFRTGRVVALDRLASRSTGESTLRTGGIHAVLSGRLRGAEWR